MLDFSTPLLETDKRSILFGSITLMLYGLLQILICIFLFHEFGLSLIIYSFGALYFLSGAIGLRSSRGNGLGLIKCFKTLLVILMVLNWFLISYLIVTCIIILTTFKKKCKKNSDYCHVDTNDTIHIIIAFSIPVLISFGSFVYLKVLYKFSKQYEDDYARLFNTRYVHPNLA